MTKAEFLQVNGEFLIQALSIGQVAFGGEENPEFTGFRWHIERNLSFDELTMIRSAGMVVGEVCEADRGGLLVWVMYDDDLQKLNRVYPRTDPQ